MDAAQMIDPRCTQLEINGYRGVVFQDRSHVSRAIPPDQEGWRALGESIGGHENLQTLQFYDVNFTPENLPALLVGVSHNRSVRELGFCRFDGDWSLVILATFFENNQNLCSLKLLNSHPIHDSVRSISEVFGSCSACSLEEIWWNHSPVGDEIISEFIPSLAGLFRLKKLELRQSNIGRRVCDAMAALLRNQSCMLQTIDFTGNNIGDEGLAALESEVAVNSTLKALTLQGIGDITPAAWISFVGILRSEICILETLNLDFNIIDDDVVVAFADALSNNTTLKSILFSQRISISDIGWSAISRTLFDKSSIINMYRCNHALRYIGGPMLPSDLVSYLELNEDDDKHALARKKIFIHFFEGDFDIEHFEENNILDSKVLPHLLSWIGGVPDRKSHTALFNFLRNVPTFCENAASRHKTRKRKAES